MSVEGIIDRIISDANTQAEKITREAQEQAAVIHEKGKKEAEEYYERQRSKLNDKYNKEKERSVLNKRLEQRKHVLKARQEWMDRAFSNAYKKLLEQPFSEYKELLKKLILRVSSTNSETVIFGNKGGEKDLRKIIDELNKKTGGSFTLSDKRGNFLWGFVLQKGKVETNMSVESLFKYKRDDLEQRAWELFNAE